MTPEFPPKFLLAKMTRGESSKVKGCGDKTTRNFDQGIPKVMETGKCMSFQRVAIIDFKGVIIFKSRSPNLRNILIAAKQKIYIENYVFLK